MELIFQSSVAASYHEALEELVFFNPLQWRAESAIAAVLEAYGMPAIVSDAAGLHVSVGGRHDAQCLFALARHHDETSLAGMLIYLRLNVEELVVLHIGVSRQYGRKLRSSLSVIMGLLRAVRSVAHRLRGVRRLRMLYLDGRQFQIAVGSRDKYSPAPPQNPVKSQLGETVSLPT